MAYETPAIRLRKEKKRLECFMVQSKKYGYGPECPLAPVRMSAIDVARAFGLKSSESVAPLLRELPFVCFGKLKLYTLDDVASAIVQSEKV